MPRAAPLFSIEIPAQAPALFDAQGHVVAPDVLAQSFAQVREAFSRLHGQRLVELMKAMFDAMPAGEKVRLEWWHDEVHLFFLRFGNGWSLGESTRSFSDGSDNHTHPSKAMAPAWMQRGGVSLERWKQWHMLLHCYTIDPNVDGDAQRRLDELSEKRDGLGAQDLPLIEQVLVGPVFTSGLARVRLEEALPAPAHRAGKPSGRGRM